jgi:hypothetical protein
MQQAAPPGMKVIPTYDSPLPTTDFQLLTFKSVRYWGNPFRIGDTSLLATVSSRATTTHLIFRLYIAQRQAALKERGFKPKFSIRFFEC